MMRVADRIMLAMLAVDGLVVGILSLAFVFVRIGGVAVPIAALGGGAINCVLLWLAAGYTASLGRFGPLIGWALGVVLGVFPGPGGDVLLASDPGLTVQTLLLLVLGAGLPAALVWSGRLPRGEHR